MTASLVRSGDLEMWAGSNEPNEFEFIVTNIPDDQEATIDDRADLFGSQFYFWIGRREEPLIQKNTIDNPTQLIIDNTNRILKWTPTLEETRLIPSGRAVSYEIERRIDGYQTPFAGGFVVMRGGENND